MMGLTVCVSKLQVMMPINQSWMKPLPQALLRCQVIIEVFKFPLGMVMIGWQVSS